MNWSPSTLREQNYQTSGLFRIPSPKKQSDQAIQTQDDLPASSISEEKAYPVEDYSWIQLKTSAEVMHVGQEKMDFFFLEIFFVSQTKFKEKLFVFLLFIFNVAVDGECPFMAGRHRDGSPAGPHRPSERQAERATTDGQCGWG